MRPSLAFLLLPFAACATGSEIPRADAPTRIVVNGRIWTGDSTNPTATALAIRHDTIIAVGDDATIRAMAATTTSVEDLGDRRVIPGLHDAHWHLPARRTADLVDARDTAEIVSRLRAFAATVPDGAPITGRGWTPTMFPRNTAHRRFLDSAFPDRIVILTDRDGHQRLVNSATLRAAAITRATQAPAGGAIVRDASGEATGLLKETAGGLVASLLADPTEAEVYVNVMETLHRAASLGLTALQIANGLSDAEQAAVQRAADQDSLPVRLRVAVPFVQEVSDSALGAFVRLRDDHRGPWLRYGIAKGMLDGTIDAASALMFAPYPGVGGTGLPRWTPTDLARTVARYDSAGIQVELHAIGDRAIRDALDAFESVAAERGPRDRRGRVEHLELPDTADIPRFRALGVIASTQPIFAIPDETTLGNYSTMLGPDRTPRALVFKALDDAGAMQAFGSDHPVFPMDPLLGMFVAVTRQTPGGTPAGGWFPAQRLTLEAALAHYTVGSAYAAFRETELGSLTPGRLADFVVLSEEIIGVAPAALLSAKPVLTVVGGRDVYRAVPLAVRFSAPTAR
jgi:predicted amidohydrolase YtcJ